MRLSAGTGKPRSGFVDELDDGILLVLTVLLLALLLAALPLARVRVRRASDGSGLELVDLDRKSVV